MDIEVLAVLAVGFVFISCILAIVAFSKVSTLDRKLAKLKMEMGRLSDTLASGAKPMVEPVAVSEKIEPPPLGVDQTPIGAAVEAPIVLQEKPKRDVEQALASRWFVWIGGAAVALGGLLLIKYAHDNGLISPALRVLLGLVFAAALVAAGEYVRRSRSADAVEDVQRSGGG